MAYMNLIAEYVIYLSRSVTMNIYIGFLQNNNNNHTFPNKYQDVIRFHSLYPWHTGGSYREFMKPEDELLLNDVRNFNTYDLYSKSDDKFKVTDDVKKYYNNLLQEFFPVPLLW